MAACSSDHPECLAALIEAGCALDAQDPAGTTALMLAAETGSIACARLLIDAGCGLDLVDQLGNSAAARSLNAKNESVALALIEAGCDVEARGFHDESLVQESLLFPTDKVFLALLGRGCRLDRPRWNGETLIHQAAGRGHGRAIGLLAKRGLDVDARCLTDGRTPAAAAIMEGKPAALEALMRAGCLVDEDMAELKAHRWVRGASGRDAHAQCIGMVRAALDAQALSAHTR